MKEAGVVYYTETGSPVGTLRLASDGEALVGLYMVEDEDGQEVVGEGWVRDDGVEPFDETKGQLEEYFEGRRRAFDLPLVLRGTEFQKRVWEELLRIPYGVTISYGDLARRVGNPKASRAVGLANGRNPISIIVPCHRVIGANGNLTGYGGGLWRKDALLTLEALRPVSTAQSSFA
jgi:methylated-DNA-[protein]-cysteine S-methyltransferase